MPWTVSRQAPLSWEFSGKNTRVGCHFLLQEIFLSQDWTASPLSPITQAYSLPSEPIVFPKSSASKQESKSGSRGLSRPLWYPAQKGLSHGGLIPVDSRQFISENQSCQKKVSFSLNTLLFLIIKLMESAYRKFGQYRKKEILSPRNVFPSIACNTAMYVHCIFRKVASYHIYLISWFSSCY